MKLLIKCVVNGSTEFRTLQIFSTMENDKRHKTAAVTQGRVGFRVPVLVRYYWPRCVRAVHKTFIKQYSFTLRVVFRVMQPETDIQCAAVVA